MVKKQFFCKEHHAQAKHAALIETKQHHKAHLSDQADRAEAKKRGGTG